MLCSLSERFHCSSALSSYNAKGAQPIVLESLDFYWKQPSCLPSTLFTLSL